MNPEERLVMANARGTLTLALDNMTRYGSASVRVNGNGPPICDVIRAVQRQIEAAITTSDAICKAAKPMFPERRVG